MAASAAASEAYLYVFAFESAFFHLLAGMPNLFAYMARFHHMTHTKVFVYKDAENLLVPADSLYRFAALVSKLSIERRDTTRDVASQQITFDIGQTLATASSLDYFLIISKNSSFYKQFQSSHQNFLFLTPQWLTKVCEMEQVLIQSKREPR